MRILGAVGSLEYNSSEAIPMLYDMAAARAAYNVEKYGTELDPDTGFAEFGRLLSNIGFNILAVSYKGVSVTL